MSRTVGYASNNHNGPYSIDIFFIIKIADLTVAEPSSAALLAACALAALTTRYQPRREPRGKSRK